MNILGFSAWFHDSGACLMRDGQLVAIAEEERFSRRKHTPEYPHQSIEYVLAAGGLRLDDVDAVAYYLDPRTLFLNQVRHLLAYLPRSLNLLRAGTTMVPVRERYRNLFRIKSILCQAHGAKGRFQLVTMPHYRTHQGAAFLCSPFDEAAIVTMDVAVDGTTQTIARGHGTRIENRLAHRLPHGWGMVYSLFTQLVGFKYYDEYKVMGMSAYGQPTHVDFIEDRLYRLDDETGAFTLNLDYFAFQHQGMRRIWSDRLLKEIGPAREPGAPLEAKHYDLAASAQRATERFGIRMARLARRLTGAENLTMAGGVVQNVLMNQAIAASGVFKQTFFQPLASDVGGPLGAALYHYHCRARAPAILRDAALVLGAELRGRVRSGAGAQRPPLHAAGRSGAGGCPRHRRRRRRRLRLRADGSGTARTGRPIDPRRPAPGRHEGHAEPAGEASRALQAVRAVLPGRARRRRVQAAAGLPSPPRYMIVTASVREGMAPRVPAITHQDGTSRPQAVDRATNPLYWQIIHEFEKLTGVPLVINTSFNDNEPIVCTPQDAINCFLRTRIDVLVLENYVVYRDENRGRVA